MLPHIAGIFLQDLAGKHLLAKQGKRLLVARGRLPPDQESVKVGYAQDSGITVYGNASTRFLYVVTNTVRDGAAASGSRDPAPLAPDDYTIRILAADHAGDTALAGRDLAITVQ